MLGFMRRHSQSRTIKILFWVIIAVFVLWGVGTFTGSDSLHAAVVNGETIEPRTLRRMENQIERSYSQLYGANFTPELMKQLDLKGQALDRLIDAVLLKQEAKRLGFTVTDEEVRNAIQAREDLLLDGRFQRDVYFRVLRMQGVSPTEFEDQVRDDILIRKVGDLVTGSLHNDEAGARELFEFENARVNLAFVRIKASDLAKEISPSESEVSKYYEEHREMFREPERVAIDYVAYEGKDFEKTAEVTDADVQQEYTTNKSERYTAPEEVHARHILFQVPRDADVKKREEIKSRATATLERLKKGEDFASVAKQMSDDAATKDKGGDLGFIARGRAEEALENAAFALQPGELSGVVETRYGYHLVKVEERHAAREKPLDEVREEIQKTLRAERARAAARDAAFTDAEKASSGKPLAEIAAARGLRVSSPAPFASNEPIAGLARDPELVKSAFATAPGQVGPVGQSGDALILFRLREKIPSAVPSLKDSRDKIIEAVRDEQGTAKARERAEAIRKKLVEKKNLEEVAAEERLTVEETGLFTRTGAYVPRIGSAADLKKAAFALTAENPIAPEAYVASGDGFVVVLKDREAADMSQFDKKKDEILKRHVNDQRQAALQAFINQLKRRARIDVNNAALAAV
jgi:peptidyl-prolyl cis-trans isomerase D